MTLDVHSAVVYIGILVAAFYASLTEHGDPRADDPPVPVYWLDDDTLISCGRDRHLKKWDGVDWVPVQ